MDGHFVPNITIGPPVVKSLRKATRLPLDCHLMIENPDQYIGDFAEAGADWISVHQEACRHLNRTLNLIKSHDCRAGVVINPATPVETLSEVLDIVDYVLVMSVNPGFGGQKFIPGAVHKIRKLAEIRGARGLFLPDRSGWRHRSGYGRPKLSGPARRFWWPATPCSAKAMLRRMQRLSLEAARARVSKSLGQVHHGATETRRNSLSGFSVILCLEVKDFARRSYATQVHSRLGTGRPGVAARLHEQEGRTIRWRTSAPSSRTRSCSIAPWTR